MSALDGKVAVVTGAEHDVGRGLALAVGGAGARVALVGDATAAAPVVADLEARGVRAAAAATDFSTRASVEAAFEASADALRAPVDLVVHAAMDPRAYEAMPIEEVDDDRWQSVWEDTMRAWLFVLQAGFAQMRGRGGRFVAVTPTVAMAGAPGLVAYAAATEGRRLLAKSAARQWGAHGITVNCLAPGPEHGPAGVTGAGASLAPPALDGPGNPETDLGPVAVWLATDAAHFVTGATVAVDGGVWMAP